MCFLFSKGCGGLVVAPCPQAMHSETGVNAGVVDPTSVHPGGGFPKHSHGPMTTDNKDNYSNMLQ